NGPEPTGVSPTPPSVTGVSSGSRWNVVSLDGIAASGFGDLNTTVVGSGALISTPGKFAAGGESNSRNRWKDATTSAESSALPSVNFTPSRSLKVQVSPASLADHSVARSPTILPVSSVAVSREQMCLATRSIPAEPPLTECGSRFSTGYWPLATSSWATVPASVAPPPPVVVLQAANGISRAVAATRPAASLTRFMISYLRW